MQLNIGTAGTDACRSLANSSDWKSLREALLERVQHYANAALECAPEYRVDNTAYARALRDIWTAFESATTGVPIQRVDRPVTGKHNAAR